MLQCQIISSRAEGPGLKLMGYENRSNQVEPDLLISVSVFGYPSIDRYGLLQGMLVRSFAADPRYASLRLDLCSGGNGKSFRPQSSAAYCKMHLCVTLPTRCSVQPVSRMRRERLVSVRRRQPGCFLRGPDRRRSSSMCTGRTRPMRATGMPTADPTKSIRGKD